MKAIFEKLNSGVEATSVLDKIVNVVVAHSWGVSFDENNQAILPQISISVVTKAVEIARQCSGTILILPNADYLVKDSAKMEAELKNQLLAKLDYPLDQVIFIQPVNNTVDEVLKVSDVLRGLEGMFINMFAVTENSHRKSAQSIWSKLKPPANPKVIGIEGVFEKASPCWFLRSKSRFKLLNLIRGLLFLIFGWRISKLHQPVKS